MPENSTQKPLNLCGLTCAFILAEIDRALAECDVVEVQCDHPTSIHETVPQYCRSHGYDLTVTPEIYPLDGQVYRLCITKPGR